MSSINPRYRIGVDIGGTFTDMIIVSDDDLHVIKVPSVPSDPEQGVINALDTAAARLETSTQDLLAACNVFIHGSTVATNTILEGKGAVVGLVTSEGFRDALEIRRGMRDSPWSHREPFSPVLVPRHRRLGIAGRIEKDGSVSEPITADSVAAVAETLKEQRVESVAVCLYNGYTNLDEELQLTEELRKHGVNLPYSTSQLAPIAGEYERTSTVVMSAYVGPGTLSYLAKLASRLAEMGLKPSVMLVQSNAGAIAVDEVAHNPATLLLSGPASAVGALRYYQSAIQHNNLISMEIGGTSCDVVVMNDGQVQFTDELDIGGYRVLVPSVEVNTIGAGGGTIARLNLAGMLEVGPSGAGARPGPACFGFGGDQPTVTDAQVVLGRLKAGPYANGAVTIDAERARTVIETNIATPLGIPCDDAAAGMIRLMEQKILGAIQELSIERGYDPSTFTLVAAGGAGPMHGASVARLLNCKQAYIPRTSGAFCAFGMLNVDAQHDYVQTLVCPIDQIDPATLESIFQELEQQARQTLEREGFNDANMAFERGLNLHYQGQQTDIRVPLSGTGFDVTQVREEFERLHFQYYGHIQPEGNLSITKVRVTGKGLLPDLGMASYPLTESHPEPIEIRRVWMDADNGWCDTRVYDGATLQPGNKVNGPAIINEGTTTIFVGVNDILNVDITNNYLISLPAQHENNA